MSNNHIDYYGSFNVDMPSKVEVDGPFYWKAAYVVGEGGFKKGGSLKIVFPPYQHETKREYVQIYDYWSPCFAWAVCDGEKKAVEVTIEKIDTAFLHVKNWPDSNRILRITAKADLKKGERIYINYGGIDRPWIKGAAPATRVGTMSHKTDGTFLKYKVKVDIDGSGRFIELNGFPPVEITPGRAESISIVAPGIVNVGEEFKIRLVVKDRFNNPIFDYHLDDPKLVIRNMKNGKIAGMAHISDNLTYRACIGEEGPYEITIDKDMDLHKEKAAVLCKNVAYKIFWGDLHSHSNLSPNIRDNDGGTDTNSCYEYAKEVSCIDFVCIPEQTFRFDDDPALNITRETWHSIGRFADQNYNPGKFVTFPGFELHSKRGDTVVLFSSSLLNVPYPEKWVGDVSQVWDFYGNSGYMTIPHLHRYCGGRMKKDQQEMKFGGFRFENWDRKNEYTERLVEIFSSQWGRFEDNEHPMLLKARSNVEGNTTTAFLNRGRLWGFTSSSDDHDGRPGYGGVTGVYAKALTREDIFSGLYNRRCIASTNPRIIICYFINDHMMGDIVTFDENYSVFRCVEVTVVSPQDIETIEIIRNGEVIYSKSINGMIAEKEFKDKDVLDENTYYYVRVKLRNGHMAWASPIWFLRK